MAYLDEESQRKFQEQFLDFSLCNPQTKEEVDSLLWRIPDMKLRLDTSNFLAKKPGFSAQQLDEFVDPVPYPMRQITIRELSSVEIDWKMLTLHKPRGNYDTIFYDKLVHLDKLTLKSLIEVKDSTEWKIKASTRINDSDDFTYEYFSIHKEDDVDIRIQQVDASNIQPQVTVATDDQDQKYSDADEENSPLKTRRRKVKRKKKRRKKRIKRKKSKKKRKRKSIGNKIKSKLKRNNAVSISGKPHPLKCISVKSKCGKAIKTKHLKKKSIPGQVRNINRNIINNKA